MVVGVPMRTIAEVQVSKRTFIYKRMMDILIFIDIFIVLLNFPYYLDFLNTNL